MCHSLPDEAAFMLRTREPGTHPGSSEALQELVDRFSEDEMRRLNYVVDGEAKDAQVVVREFLQQKKL